MSENIRVHEFLMAVSQMQALAENLEPLAMTLDIETACRRLETIEASARIAREFLQGQP